MEQRPGAVIHIHLDLQKFYQTLPRRGLENILGRWLHVVRRIFDEMLSPTTIPDNRSIGISPGGAAAAELFACVLDTTLPEDQRNPSGTTQG